MWEPPEPETLKDQLAKLISMRSWMANLAFDAMTGFQATEMLEFGAKVERFGVALQMLAAPRVDDTFVWRQEGHRSAATYLAEKTGTTEGSAAGVLETARQLGDLPETARCLTHGSFSAQQVKEIASAATVHPGAEGELIEAAARSGLKGLRSRCERTKALASWENDEVGRENAIRKSRFLRHYRDPDGGVRLVARLTPVDAARILEAVKAKAGVFFDEARTTGHYESMAAYMADGLVSLADDAICGPGTGVAKPTVVLRVDLPALKRGELEGDEVCEIPGVGPVSLATARSVLGDAFVKIVIRDGTDIRSVCHPGRTVPAHLETAVKERDLACAVPRCDNDFLLDIHHIVAVTDGGPTCLSNLVRICKWHHALITYEGWKLLGQPGDWAWHPPPDFDLAAFTDPMVEGSGHPACRPPPDCETKAGDWTWQRPLDFDPFGAPVSD
jgi:hypothetical protein